MNSLHDVQEISEENQAHIDTIHLECRLIREEVHILKSMALRRLVRMDLEKSYPVIQGSIE